MYSALDKPGPVGLLPRRQLYPQIYTKTNTSPSESTLFAPTRPVYKEAGGGERIKEGR